MLLKPRENDSLKAILYNMLFAAVSLFVNGFGVYLTIQANIGLAPWDVLNQGLSKSLGILYGNASITVSVIILLIDVLMKEPIGIAIFIDAIVVGKSVDFCNYLGIVPKCGSVFSGILVMIAGFFVLAFTQYTYMLASLGGSVGIGTLLSAFGCGPVMQFVFRLVRFDATEIKHQRLGESYRFIFKTKSESKG